MFKKNARKRISFIVTVVFFGHRWVTNQKVAQMFCSDDVTHLNDWSWEDTHDVSIPQSWRLYWIKSRRYKQHAFILQGHVQKVAQMFCSDDVTHLNNWTCVDTHDVCIPQPWSLYWIKSKRYNNMHQFYKVMFKKWLKCSAVMM